LNEMLPSAQAVSPLPLRMGSQSRSTSMTVTCATMTCAVTLPPAPMGTSVTAIWSKQPGS